MISITKMEKDAQALDVVLRKLKNMEHQNYELLNAVQKALEIKERQLLKARKYRYRNSTK